MAQVSSRKLRDRLALHQGKSPQRSSSIERNVHRLAHRLPLPYFDSQPRGELLSRVTNDIDNVSQSLTQTLNQLLNSLLTVVAMLAMMV